MAVRLNRIEPRVICTVPHQMLHFHVCYQDLKRTEEPKCRYQEYSYKRHRVGRGWSGVSWNGVSQSAHTDYYCRRK